MKHYDDSIPTALMDLFPEIGLDRMQFSHCMFRFNCFCSFFSSFYLLLILFLSSFDPLFIFFLTLLAGPWRYEENRRQFFEDYAKSSGFDPLLAHNWYKQPVGRILSAKV